jgi:uncharacterized protein
MLLNLYRFRFILLAITMVFCVLVWPCVRSAVKVDNSLTIWFLKDDPALKEYKQFHQEFGNDEVVILLLEDTTTLLSKQYFSSFIAMTKQLESLPEIQMVVGAGNADVVSKDLFGMLSKPLLTDSSEPADIRSDLLDMPALREQLFNKDFTAARFLISFKNNVNLDTDRARLLAEVKRIVHEHIPPAQAHFGGVGIVYDGLNALSNHDFGFFLGIGYLAMFILLWWIYRKLLLLLYAILTIAVSTYITLGLYGLAGLQLNLMTILIPAILIVLGIMDIMHILNECNQLVKKIEDRKQRVLLALKLVFRPCLFTTLTTMAGFLSLLLTPMAILQQFGLFTAIGILLCLVFTYVFGVLFLSISTPSTITIFSARRLVNDINQSVLKHPRMYTAILVCIMLISVAGLFFLKSDTYTLGYLPAKNEVVQDHKKMEALWGPYMPLELVVIPAKGKTLYDTAIIKNAIAFGDSARKINGVGGLFGFQSFYQAALVAQYHQQSATMIRSSSVLATVHQQLPVYYPALYSGFIHEPTQTGRITLFGKMTSAKELTRKMDTVLAASKYFFGNTASVAASGYQPMYADIVSYITTSQVNSLLVSGIMIFVLVLIFIRHLRLTILATVANFIPVVVMLGIMGLTGIYLDTASASIAAIVLSICIDDTIHYIYHYKHLRQEGATQATAQRETMDHIGSSILLASIVLIAGYALMIFGSLKTVQLFGLLTVIALVVALYAELIIFPLVLKRFDNTPYKVAKDHS